MKVTTMLVALFIFSTCFAQSNNQSSIDSLAGELVKCIRSNDPKNILMNTDRRVYAAGERVYFRAYLVDSLRNHIQTKPKKLYVDMVDKDDKVLAHLLLNASLLKTNGDIKLSDTLTEGFYWLRAYTSRMLESNLQGIAVEPIYVVNGNKRQNNNRQTPNKNFEALKSQSIVELFPEGGSIISGLNTTIGLKLSNPEGLPWSDSGYIKDKREGIVARFFTDSKGLAKFSFSPTWYGKYSVYIKTSRGYDSVATLPSVDPFSAQIAVTNQSDQSLNVRVALEDSIYSKNYTTYLIALNDDSLCFASVGQGMYNVNIPLANFPSGVAKLLLFNADKNLLSERKVYVNKENYQVDITTDKAKYAAREKVDVDISVKDATGKPLLSVLTVSVTESNALDTLLRWQNDSLKNLSAAEADLVLLATKPEGKVCSNQDMQQAYEEQDIDTLIKVSGVVYDAKKQAVPNSIVSIIANNQNFLYVSDTTDDKGRFEIALPDYDNTTDFKIQVSKLNGKKEESYKVLYDAPLAAQFTTPAYLKRTFEFTKEFQQAKARINHKYMLQADSASATLNNVTVQTYNKADNLSHGHIITADNIGQGAGMVGNAVLRIPGVHYVNGNVLIGGLADMNGPSARSEPVIMLDGVQQTVSSVMSFLNSLSTDEVGSIEVLSGPNAAAYGVRGGNGVIIINSARSIETDAQGQHTLTSFHPSGYYSAPPFSMPDYSKKEIKNGETPDTRTTIYWNGDVMTNKNGSASIQFFTADNPATYIISVTGLSANGDKIYKTATISRR